MGAPAESPAEPANRFFVVLYQTGRYEDHLGYLSRPVFDDLEHQLDDSIQSEPEKTEIDLWLESGGGDAHIAYKLWLELKSRCRWLRVVIPDYAKSAATLLSLGADEIYMRASAELGPLDVQVFHPDRETVQLSGLDIANSINFIASFGADYITDGARRLQRRMRLASKDAVGVFAEFAAGLLEPVVSKLDPQLIRRAASDLEIAASYARRMLEGRKCEVPENFDAADVARHLVFNYPAHGYVISRDEAANLGLPVKKFREYDNWQAAKHLYREFCERLQDDDNPPRSVVLVISESEVNNELESSDRKSAEDEIVKSTPEPRQSDGGDHENHAQNAVFSGPNIHRQPEVVHEDGNAG